MAATDLDYEDDPPRHRQRQRQELARAAIGYVRTLARRFGATGVLRFSLRGFNPDKIGE
jgi:hypothetical protein